MSELRDRREKLFALMKENSAAVIFAGAAKISTADEFYPFISNRNFFYLSNIEQENSILLLIKGIGEKKVYLFVDEYNELKEKWTGKRLTFEQAGKIADIQNVYATSSFENMLSMALAFTNNQYGNISTLYLDLTPELKIKEAYSTSNFKDFIALEYPHVNVEDIYPHFKMVRMIKSEYEVRELVEAINATYSGISHMLVKMTPGMTEYNLADIFEFYGREHGRHELAFSTIIACGKNATCLHYPYEQQNDPILENRIVQFDLGYKHNGYCADISRAYPVSGKFDSLQRDIYTAVLNCNKAVINYIKPGLTLLDLQNFAKEFLRDECIRLKLMNKDDDIGKYYYHNVSHHLGLDTHDISDREKPLENGNIITVEPGLYFANHGIGVRIEDDVLIRDGHGECLSHNIPKEIEDIERLLQSKERY